MVAMMSVVAVVSVMAVVALVDDRGDDGGDGGVCGGVGRGAISGGSAVCSRGVLRDNDDAGAVVDVLVIGVVVVVVVDHAWDQESIDQPSNTEEAQCKQPQEPCAGPAEVESMGTKHTEEEP
eukprot:TRINITY_DN612_c0_g1_i2.p3 TRINITY_DN612_c0_g1~~TRINITY_DN612_c0_g1_i2.p3  ORF type:complete len:122 (+),score=18.91 TRINITY_DN612_c0_g1_i2:163-528(+)